jgi:hypothetical protein
MSSHPISTTQPTTAMIVEWYIHNKFGEIDPDKRYPARDLLTAIIKILVNKHRHQQLQDMTFNQLLFAALTNDGRDIGQWQN